MYIFLLIIFIALGIIEVILQRKKKKAADIQKSRTLQNAIEQSQNFWPTHPLFEKITSWVNACIRHREKEVSKVKIHPGEDQYLCFQIYPGRITLSVAGTQDPSFASVKINEFSFFDAGYEDLNEEKEKSLYFALRNAIAKTYGSQYPVSFVNEDLIYIKMNNAYIQPVLKQV